FPVALRPTVSDGVSGSLLTIASVSVCVPAVVGENFSVTVPVEAPATVNGDAPDAVGDTTENGLFTPPVIVRAVILSVPVPKLITVRVAVELAPMFVSGKTTGFGSAAILTVVGFPLIGIEKFWQVVLIARLAVAGPAAVGVNLTTMVNVWVGDSVTGSVNA